MNAGKNKSHIAFQRRAFLPGCLFSFFPLLLFLGCEPLAKNEEQAILAFGSHGDSPGRFLKPRAMAISPSGLLYVVDLSGRIQAFSKEGKYLFHFRTPAIEKGKPTGLGFSPDGNLFVADTHYHRVLCYSCEGKLLFQFGEYGIAPHEFGYVTDVAVDKDRTIYVSQYGDALGQYDRIQKFSIDGKFIKAWGQRGTGDGEFERPIDRKSVV